MRTPPTIETSGTFKLDSHTTANCTALAAINNTEVGSQFRATVASGLSASAGTSYSLLTSANTDYLAFSAEL